MCEHPWIDVSRFGSEYQEETNLHGQWRHRKISVKALDSDPFNLDCRMVGEWIAGKAPDDVGAELARRARNERN